MTSPVTPADSSAEQDGAGGQRTLVTLTDIRKSFGDLVANDGVDLTLRSGEVHALLGENGAGKSTLMRILYGLSRPDSGTISVDGRPVQLTSPGVAIAHGIGMVTQHFSLVGPMTVTENVLLTSAGLGLLDLRTGRRMVVEAAERIGVRIDPDARVDRLSVGEQQRVEILKALTHECKVLILDEPTAVLVPQDVEALFRSVRRLTDAGMGVLFISHKLGEVVGISDRVSVLRRGRIVDTVATADASIPQLAELMVGRPTLGVRRADRPNRGDDDLAAARAVSESDLGSYADVETLDVPRDRAILEIREVRLAGRSRDVLDGLDLSVHPGEIVGMAGISGNGQTELVQVLSGLRHPDAGTIEVNQTDITRASPAEVIAAGLGRITEDRYSAVVPDLSVEQNLVLEDLGRFRRGPFLDKQAVRVHATELIERYSVKAAPGDSVGSLSGGNMQKVVLARALARDPMALVVSQPTRGLDVGAAEFVHTQLLARRAAGAGVLLISEDLEELLALADRIVVVYEGRIVGELPVADATPERLGLLMAGETAA
ncbi:MAG: ABC transporter ATP-binding protein [Nocardioidaceae bacterium]|nr:ABC transporter ATP-binding protein [Nocardioidaceae bacterium]